MEFSIKKFNKSIQLETGPHKLNKMALRNIIKLLFCLLLVAVKAVRHEEPEFKQGSPVAIACKFVEETRLAKKRDMEWIEALDFNILRSFYKWYWNFVDKTEFVTLANAKCNHAIYKRYLLFKKSY